MQHVTEAMRWIVSISPLFRWTKIYMIILPPDQLDSAGRIVCLNWFGLFCETNTLIYLLICTYYLHNWCAQYRKHETTVIAFVHIVVQNVCFNYSRVLLIYLDFEIIFVYFVYNARKKIYAFLIHQNNFNKTKIWKPFGNAFLIDFYFFRMLETVLLNTLRLSLAKVSRNVLLWFLWFKSTKIIYTHSIEMKYQALIFNLLLFFADLDRYQKFLAEI